MDPITGLLDGPRARAPFLLRTAVDPPWAIRIADGAPLSVVAVLAGRCWYLPDAGDPVALRSGDVTLHRGPLPYTYADDPATAVQAVIHPGQRCTTPGGAPLESLRSQGRRTWGHRPDGRDVLLTGTYEHAGQVSHGLLDLLPPFVLVRRGEWRSPFVDLLVAELERDGFGDDAVRSRLLDLVTVDAVRHWLATGSPSVPGWHRAHDDPVAGAAVRLLQLDPARPWTVAALAAEVGVSRAVLARRFHDAVGEPPMAFLTGHRLRLAADLLLEPGATVGGVAAAVGYRSPFTFSTAFSRMFGVAPSRHRASGSGTEREGADAAASLSS